MKLTLQKWFNQLIKTIQRSLERFPETLLLAYTFAVAWMLMTHADYDAETYREVLEKVMLTASLGVAMSASFTLIVERWGKAAWHRLAADGVLVLLLTWFYVTIPADYNQIFIFKYFVMVISFYLAFSLVPFWYSKKNYAMSVLKLISDAAITILFSLVLYLGTTAILFALDELFSLNIDSELYLDAFIIIAAMFAPTHFLGAVIKKPEDMAAFEFSLVFKILLNYIVAPLLVIYTGILYAYFIKLIFDGALPQGLLGHLVIWYGLIAVVLLFFTKPLADELVWTKWFQTWLPRAMVISLAMMFLALYIRVDAYGLTVRRYFVIALGLWVTGNVIYHLVSKKRINQIIVVSAVGVMLLAMNGPINAYSLSIWHQNQRFENLLIENGMLANGIIIPKEDASEALQQKVGETIYYFESQHTLKDLKLLPEAFKPTTEMKEVFGFDYTSHGYFGYGRYVSAWYEAEGVVDVKGYHYWLNVNAYKQQEKDIQQDTIDWQMLEDTLVIYDQGVEVERIPLIEILSPLVQDNDRSEMLTKDQATFTYTGVWRYQIILGHINGEMADGQFNWQDVSCHLLIAN